MMTATQSDYKIQCSYVAHNGINDYKDNYRILERDNFAKQILL